MGDVIEHDPDDHSREYIPLPGGWEVQTKGRGSSYRLLDKKTGERHAIISGADWRGVQDFFTRFAREVFNASRAEEKQDDAAVTAESTPLAQDERIGEISEALARAQAWHESEDKALSKSGRNDADYHWRRLQHREQLAAIRAALPAAEYDAAWDRINARIPDADDDPS
ncbi:hypothetical protein ABIE41_003893 [Bosea sp. OAE506]|uniref:hypothetical protein n=1 Tax=Bosea sp. OAE506 TaxID=2663870 RepID=UPI00178B7E19